MVTVNAATTHARAHALEVARTVAWALFRRWGLHVGDDGVVVAVVVAGAEAVPLTPALVAAGAVLELIADASTTLPCAVAEDAALLLDGLVRMRDAGVDVREPFTAR